MPAMKVVGVKFFNFVADWRLNSHVIDSENCPAKLRERQHYGSAQSHKISCSGTKVYDKG